MIGRIGFRRVLPILATLIHLAVLIAARQQPHTSSAVRGDAAYVLAAHQEQPIQWEPREPKPLRPAQKLGIVLNLPALILGIPIALAFFQGNDIGSLYAAAPFVPFVWYGVGSWLDRLVGNIPPLAPQRRTWRGLFAVVSTILLCVGIASITPVNHHRTRDSYWVGSAIILWSGLFLAISVSRPRVPTRS